MEGQGDLFGRLKNYAVFLEDTVKMFEDFRDIHGELMQSKALPNEYKNFLKKASHEDLLRLVSYVHVKDRFYNVFPELRSEDGNSEERK